MTTYSDELVAEVAGHVLKEALAAGWKPPTELAFNPDQPRDEGGRFEGGGSSSTSGPTASSLGVAKMEGSGKNAGQALGQPGFQTAEEFQQTADQRDAKIAACPQPTAEQVAKNQEMIANSSRPGGDFRGSSYSRRTNTGKLLNEFGDGEHTPCVWCGRIMNGADLSQDKIYTGEQGGRYTYANLLPSCLGCNQSRGATSIVEGLAASVRVPFKDGQHVTASPLGWAEAQAQGTDDVDVAVPTFDGVPQFVTGKLASYKLEAPDTGIKYTKYIVGGMDVDPETIDAPDPGPPRGLDDLLGRTASGAVGAPDRTNSRKLVDIDRQLRTRLQTAANAAMKRTLEKTGAKLVTKSRTASGAPLRPFIDGQPPHLMARLVPQALKASLGLDDHLALQGAWVDLQRQFDQWVADAQTQAARAAAKIVKKDPAEAARQLKSAQDVARGQAWVQFELQLSGQAKDLLDSAGAEGRDEAAQIAADRLVPYSFIRTALALAGGIAASSAGIGRSGRPVMGGEVMGQVGTGGIITTYLQANGAQVVEYEWVHGVSEDAFPPHEDLDGVIFHNFDDPVLAVDGDFPDTGFEHPGDHEGCSCDFIQHWVGGPDTGAA